MAGTRDHTETLAHWAAVFTPRSRKQTETVETPEVDA
jgi:hypothetical protein